MFKLRLILNLWDKNGERIETQKEKQITKWQIVTKSSRDITVNYNLSSILLILMYKEKNEWSWYLNSGLFRKIDNTCVMCVENGGAPTFFSSLIPLLAFVFLLSWHHYNCYSRNSYFHRYGDIWIFFKWFSSWCVLV